MNVNPVTQNDLPSDPEILSPLLPEKFIVVLSTPAPLSTIPLVFGMFTLPDHVQYPEGTITVSPSLAESMAL